jgi:hypothetical protein
MTRAALAVAVLVAWSDPGPAAPIRVGKPPDPAAELKRKLPGDWTGASPCDGELTFRADGTYVRTGYGPDGLNSAGTWEVRAGTRPPTLVLTCGTSDDPDDVYKVAELQIVKLDDTSLVYAPKGAKPVRYTRAKE